MTTRDANRAATGQWFVFAEESTTLDGAVPLGDVVHLLNNYQTAQGGWLEINGNGDTGTLHNVYTSAYCVRGGAASWRFKAPAP
ncbi:hypothetical protein [Streptomyces sp. GMR22]|uniref:hypothetical protein n=1 Tax=Streptomyces sp. GMR22 TaxID=2759524 RepID=UPI0015FDE875|nr:hypothetical protein [Streptomyces sp. GMR22]MBA6434353.1 hypothetical protein [Streptomyces sp. GMR22]